MPDTLTFAALTAFGLESVVRRELEALGYQADVKQPGRVSFHAPPEAAATTNIWLRAASRVVVELDRAPCADFDDLYDLARRQPWADVLPTAASIGVRVSAARSQIRSPRSAQGIVKRAIVDSLVGRSGQLDESGPAVTIGVAITGDEACIDLDTSGDGLHKRGYRPRSGPGQVKETLAAGILQLINWRGDRPIIDPFCGQGTFLIEAAMLAAGIPPGGMRRFAGEVFGWIPAQAWQDERAERRPLPNAVAGTQLLGRDASGDAIGEARRAAERAGVKPAVSFRVAPLGQLPEPADIGWVVTNPPYGMRVLEAAEAARLHAQLPPLLARLPGWSHAIITAQHGFERLIRQQATKRRKLYNGTIPCTLYTFRPARQGERTQPAFGDTHDRDAVLDSFRAAFAKRWRHLRRWPKTHGTDCYRIYDGQTPGVPCSVDRLGAFLRVTPLRDDTSRPIAEETVWYERIAQAVSQITSAPPDRVLGPHAEPPLDIRQIAVLEDGITRTLDLTDPASEPQIDRRLIRARLQRMASEHVLLLGERDPACERIASRCQNWTRVEQPEPWLLQPVTAATSGFSEALLQVPRAGWSSDRRQQAQLRHWLHDICRRILPRLAAGGTLRVVTPGRWDAMRGFPPGEAKVLDTKDRTIPEDFTHSTPHRSWILSRSRGANP
ncbi:MAG: class I SAM-dependent RNA methyltransferase [Planctomycetota bacterium]